LRNHPLFGAYAALCSICFFWGTTYLGIRMALESFPPLLLVASRFCLSGTLMLIGARLAGMRLPQGRELAWSALHGVLILGVGNGCLVFSELLIPSSLAALFIAASPFWMVGIEAAMPGGERLRWLTALGMLIGFAGAAILVAPGILHQGEDGFGTGSNVWKGFLILQLGGMSWGFGSILARRHKTRAHPVISGAVQQLAAGLAFAVPTLVAGSGPIAWSGRGTAAILWLVVFGSVVGYSSYVYALDKLPVALVSIYTYVNPVVAAALGWLFYREPFGRREALAMTVIFTGVAIVKRFSDSRRETGPAAVSPSRALSRPGLRRSSEGP
jgi:drug/metabolite transporter (DMT)-like permease